MKSISITYDETTANLNLSSQGLTEAEVLVFLMEAQQKVKDCVVEALKKKSSGIITPHLMRPINKA